MRREIAAVVFFLKRLVRRGDKLELHKIELFVERLAVALQEKFKGHWYPENPSKGQAYRYGEQNPCFSVASFSSDDEEDRDVAKKVTSALERVTSDYHSGSSSDEESIRTSPLTISSNRCASQALNPAALTWHPKKMVPGQSHILPQPHYSFRPRSKGSHSVRHNLWVPPGYRGGPGYWDMNQKMPYCYS